MIKAFLFDYDGVMTVNVSGLMNIADKEFLSSSLIS